MKMKVTIPLVMKIKKNQQQKQQQLKQQQQKPLQLQKNQQKVVKMKENIPKIILKMKSNRKIHHVVIVVIEQLSELYFLSCVSNNTRLGLFNSFIQCFCFFFSYFLYIVFSIINNRLVSFRFFLLIYSKKKKKRF
jgi:hypothetical protein